MYFSFGKVRARNIFRDTFKPSDPEGNSEGVALGSTKKLFTPPPMVNSTPDPSGDDNTDDGSFNRRRASKLLMDEYSAPSVATDRYNKFLADQPSEADYHASRKRTIAGILTGAALGFAHPDLGAEVGSKIITQPFDDKLADWTRKEAPLRSAATSEGTAKTQRINALKDFIQSEHQSSMDESLIGDRTDARRHRKVTENTASATLLDKIANEQALDKNRRDDNARADAAAKELVAQHEWERKHGDRTAAVMERNAATSEGRAGAYGRNIDSNVAYKKFLEDKLANIKGDSSGAQKIAEDLAKTNVFLKPGNSQIYSDFITQDDKGHIKITPPNRGYFDSEESFNAQMADYSRLKKELDDETGAILKKNHPTNTANQKPPKKAKVLGRETVPENR